MLRKIPFAAIAILAFAGQAHAALVQVDSEGAFSNVVGCGAGNDCAISGGPNGPNTVLSWGDDPNDNPSTLTAVAVDNLNAAPANDIIIGRLEWRNRATRDTSNDFLVSYTLTIAFPQPAGSTVVVELFIINPTRPPGDTIGGLTVADLSNMSFTLPGAIVSDLHYVVSGGGASFNSGTGIWFLPENQTSTLKIVADFTATAVPEPATLALLGTGLFGVGLACRRRHNKTV